jgi:hypothetical protein
MIMRYIRKGAANRFEPSHIMPKPQDPLNAIRIATPCEATWARMAGDERLRHCTLCDLNVYNFAQMTRDEIRELLARAEGRVCARLYRRADGTLLTSDCPSGFRAARQRISRLGAAAVAAVISASTFAFGCATSGQLLNKHRSKVTLEVERSDGPQQATLAGVVRDESQTPLPGVTIVVRDELAKTEFTAITDVDGAFSITSLADSIYRVEVTLSGFNSVVVEHITLKQDETTRARVVLRINSTETVIVGAIAADPLMSNGFTITKDMIDKLPIDH